MIDINRVSVSLNGTPILRNVSLEVKPEDFVFVIGASGVGKTTLLRMLYFDLLPTEGEVRVREFTSREMTPRKLPLARRHLGVVFQDFKLLGDRNVFENVAVSLYVTNTPKKKIHKRVLDVLDEVGISNKRDKKPGELSVGEQQRVAIARAIVNEPFVLLADEPTGNLDPATAQDIVMLLRKIHNHGTAVVMTTHDYDLLKLVPGARVITIENGAVASDQTTQEFMKV
jgi:cell division transport system ATP-binding protein